jgi:hypothetical protein
MYLGCSSSRVIGANSDIRIGIAGVGSKGNAHIDDFQKIQGVRLVAICDVDKQILRSRAEALAGNGMTVEQYTDVRQMLDNKEIDAVVIAAPNHWHSLMGIWACQAGKDVYIEKPISHNIWEGRKLVEAARKYNRIVQAGTQNRSDTGFREALAYIGDGNIGKIKWAYGLWYKERESIGKVSGPQTVPDYIDYNMWTGPATMEPLMRQNLHYDWHWVWNTGNGDMGNLGAHQVDDCIFALGIKSFPKRVMSLGNRFIWDDDGETPNTQLTLYDMDETPFLIEIRNLPMGKGVRAMDHLRGVRMGNIIQCEAGYFAGGRGGGWIYDNDNQKLKHFPGDGGATHQANFIEAVRNRDQSALRTEIEVGHVSAAFCHLSNISYRLGKPVTVKQLSDELADFVQAPEALERIVSHLGKNDVSLKEHSILGGEWVTLDAKTERYIGPNAAEANKHLKRAEYREPFIVPENV